MLLVQLFYGAELCEHLDVNIVESVVIKYIVLKFLFHKNQDNGLSDTFYNSDWYVLPLKVQKHLVHLIQGTQNGEKLAVGPFGVINREYFSIVII